MSHTLDPKPEIASRIVTVADRIGLTAGRNPRAALAFGFGIALLGARFLFLDRASLAGHVVFVAGGSAVAAALFWLSLAFRHG